MDRFDKINWSKVASAVIAAENKKNSSLNAGGNVYIEPSTAAKIEALDSIKDNDEYNALKKAGYKLIGNRWCTVLDNQILDYSQEEAVKIVKIKESNDYDRRAAERARRTLDPYEGGA